MLSLVPGDGKRHSLIEATHAEVSRFLNDVFTADDGLLSDLDRWTQRGITLENFA